MVLVTVVVATTKVRIFKQITTLDRLIFEQTELLLLPQRYVFSSKSQPEVPTSASKLRCCCYHKGTYFQANHNNQIGDYSTDKLLLLPQRYVFSSKSQPEFTTEEVFISCCCYHKGTYFQANHNYLTSRFAFPSVVVATTKVRIFKQITTQPHDNNFTIQLLLLPQRYVFSSKSQLIRILLRCCARCCCYHKGTYFQANHNIIR